jgi:hypothetical protein
VENLGNKLMGNSQWQECETAAARVFRSTRDSRSFLKWLLNQFGYRRGLAGVISVETLTDDNKIALKDLFAKMLRQRQGKRSKAVQYSDLSHSEQARVHKVIKKFLDGNVRKSTTHIDSRLRRDFADAMASQIEALSKRRISYASITSGKINSDKPSRAHVVLIKTALDWIFHPTVTKESSIIKWLQSFRRGETPAYRKEKTEGRIHLTGTIAVLSNATKVLKPDSRDSLEVRRAMKILRRLD